MEYRWDRIDSISAEQAYKMIVWPDSIARFFEDEFSVSISRLQSNHVRSRMVLMQSKVTVGCHTRRDEFRLDGFDPRDWDGLVEGFLGTSTPTEALAMAESVVALRGL